MSASPTPDSPTHEEQDGTGPEPEITTAELGQRVRQLGEQVTKHLAENRGCTRHPAPPRLPPEA